MAGEVDKTRRRIIIGGPALAGFASSGVLTACGSSSSSSIGGTTPGGMSAVQEPTINPSGGTFPTAQTVSLSTGTSGATIYYTSDGTIPTMQSVAYTSPISITSSAMVQAIAAAPQMQNSAVASAQFKIDPSTAVAATPTFSPPAGTYSGTQTIALSSSTAGAKIYYTTNGVAPTTSSAAYASPITVSASETIEAIAVAAGMQNSAAASAKYTIDPTVVAAAAPVFSPPAGSYASSQTVSLSSTTPGAKIYYTTNGTTPSISSPTYSSPIQVSASETLQAITITAGFGNSPISSAKYTIESFAQAPTFSPPAGTYSGTQTIALSSTTAGAKIYYTTNGTAPTTSSTAYASPITVSASETIDAIAVSAGMQNSAAASAKYTIDPKVVAAAAPVFSPPAGAYTSAQLVSISSTTPGAKIYYTTDGSTPSTSSPSYISSIQVSASETLQAITIAAGYGNSSIASAGYTINTSLSAYDGMLSVSGGAFVNGAGQVLQLRGANAQGGFPFLMYPGSTRGNATDASGGVECGCDQANGCNTGYLAQWKFNCVRIGMNTANILGKTVYDSTGTVINPSSNAWLSQLVTYVSQLNAIGCYVSLVMAWDSPGNSPPLGQDYMATQDNAIQAWQAITRLFGYPNGTALKKNGGTVDNKSVIFELYNEPEGVGSALLYQGGFANLPYHCYGNSSETSVYPFPCGTPSGGSGSGQYFTPGENFTSSSGASGQIHCYYENTTTGLASSATQFIHLRNGNSAISVPSGTTIRGSSSGATVTTTSATFGWYVAGYYQMLSAIRAAGGQNVCLIGGGGWCQDLSGFQTYAQADPQPAGYSEATAWSSPQYGAAWHPYPPYTWVNSATVASGGSGYAINDTILLPMDESGDAKSGNCYWQGQLKVTGVSGTAVNAVSPVTSYRVGIPGGINGQGNSGQFNFGYGAGIWAPTFCNVLPANPVPQYSGVGGQPGTSGAGAAFNITWGLNSGFPMQANWPTVVDIKNAGYPVCITETGEHTGTGIVGSPYMAALTSWCDANGIGMVAYTYTPSAGWYDAQGYDYCLTLSSLSGTAPNQYRTPSPGYGQFMFKWFTNHA